MTKSTIRVVAKPLLKNSSPIIRNNLTMSNIKTKQNFQRKCGILSQQIKTQKFPRKACEDVPL